MLEPSSLRQNGGTDTTEYAAEESNSLGFTLNVDLSDCVGLPAHFRVWVRQNCHRTARSMSWLGDHVRRLANIRGPFLMLADKYLLPPNETLRLLQSTDSVRLARVEHEWQRPFSYDIDNCQVDGAHHFTQHDIQKTHEVQEAQNSSQIRNVSPVPQPSPQNSPLPPPTLPNNAIKQTTIKMSPVSDLHTEQSLASTPDIQPSIDKKLQSVKRRALALLQQVAGEDQEGQDNVDAPRKRRRRVRRRRPTRPISPFVEPTDPKFIPMEPPALKSTVNTTLPNVQSTPKTSKVLPPPDSPDTHSQTYTPSDTITAPSTSSIPDISTDGYLKVIPAYNDQPESHPTSSIVESPSECQTDRSRSPSPVSQISRAPKLVSTTVALLTLESAMAPVVRNQAATRAPRVVRALSTGPVE